MKKTTAYCDLCEKETDGTTLALAHTVVDLCSECSGGARPLSQARGAVERLIHLEAAADKASKERAEKALLAQQQQQQSTGDWLNAGLAPLARSRS